MSGFTKLHSTILNSSIWNESDDTRLVWITMLAMADEEGMVKGSMGGLAHQARKSIEATEKAVAVLEAPDKDSSRPHHEGRRIERVDGGWKVLNHGYYRELGMSDATREYWRKKQSERRQQLNVKDSQGQSRKHASASVVASVPEGMQGEDAHTPTLAEFQKHAEGLCIPPTVVEACYHYYAAAGFCRGQTRLTNFKSLLMAWWAKEQSNPKKQQAARPRMAI